MEPSSDLPAAPTTPPAFSALGASVPQRLGIASLLIALIWLAVYWARA
ncbi:MAG: hypothetical protein WBG82_09050 [Parvibaculum sp.]